MGDEPDDMSSHKPFHCNKLQFLHDQITFLFPCTKKKKKKKIQYNFNAKKTRVISQNWSLILKI